MWGGQFEMIALSNALNIQIVLFQETQSLLTIRNDEEEYDQIIFVMQNSQKMKQNRESDAHIKIRLSIIEF